MASSRKGDVVKGPDDVGDNTFRPWVCATDDFHPFDGEEALWVVVTTTPRPAAVELPQSDFSEGGLPKRSFANPWTVVPIRYADMSATERRLEDPTTDEIAKRAAAYLAPGSFSEYP